MTNMTAVINIITVAVQTTILLLFRNYFVYLILGAVINTVQWYFINCRIFSLYPYLKEKDAKIYKALDNLEAVVQHNLSPISTWLPNEYQLNQTYAQERVGFSPWMIQLREEMRKDTLDKIEQGQKNQ